jgi:hypothetical protein
LIFTSKNLYCVVVVITMANQLPSYYASREVIDQLPLPWNVKKGLKSRVGLPVHPVVKGMKKFFQKWKKDCSEMYDLHDPQTLFEGGNMPLLLHGKKRTYDFVTDKMTHAHRYTPFSVLRVFFDFSVICDQYEWRRHDVPHFIWNMKEQMRFSFYGNDNPEVEQPNYPEGYDYGNGEWGGEWDEGDDGEQDEGDDGEWGGEWDEDVDGEWGGEPDNLE